MPAPFTTPPTFTPGQIVTATDFNAYLRDNPLYLLTRPNSQLLRDKGSNYTTTSTSFVDVDATNLSIQLAVSGSVVLLGFCGVCYNSAAGNVGHIAFDFSVNGTRIGAAGVDGLTGSYAGGTVEQRPVTMIALATGLTPGLTHTFRVQWRVNTAAITGNLTSGSGSGGSDWIIPFFAVEVG
jgi:hypothetical protein